MTYELTKESLFSYFDPAEVSKIIELPLILRHLSVYEYNLCKTACLAALSSPSPPSSPSSPKERYADKESVLDFEALRRASIADVIQYLAIPGVRAAYLQAYGEYFVFFESQLIASKDKLRRKCGDVFPVIDDISEKKLIFAIKSAVVFPLEVCHNALVKQDVLLQAMTSVFTKQASKAQEFIAVFREKELEHKDELMKLAFSFVKLGLGVVNAGELLNIGAVLTELVTHTFDQVEAKFGDFVLGVQNLVASTHYGVLVAAEKGLFSTDRKSVV